MMLMPMIGSVRMMMNSRKDTTRTMMEKIRTRMLMKKKMQMRTKNVCRKRQMQMSKM